MRERENSESGRKIFELFEAQGLRRQTHTASFAKRSKIVRTYREISRYANMGHLTNRVQHVRYNMCCLQHMLAFTTSAADMGKRLLYLVFEICESQHSGSFGRA
jgi:hypothetical protein